MPTIPTRVGAVLRPRNIAIALAAVAVLYGAHRVGAGPILKNALDWIRGLGALAPLAFIAIYIAACVAFLPGSILTIGAGVIFGVVRGSIYVSIAATLGATAAFLVGRYFARDWIARKLDGNAKFKAIDEAVGREGWKIVILTRLSPVFPFNLLNYAYGLTRVTLGDYFFASWAGMIPGTILYVYIGALSGDLAGAAGSGSANTPMSWVVKGVGLLATVGVVIYATRIGARALREKT
ncbi:MAG TPA: TVP38/TMEM64 family protein [Candidatus Acidoferrales bacterium]|nr:TVP38/TMEM64 family protein [Candidatus Acidoferrales bacterium]